MSDSSAILETKRVLHGNGSVTMLAMLQVLRSTGSVEDPEKLAALEAGIRAGTIALAVYLQLDGDTLFLSANAVPGGRLQDPFGEGGIKITGPLVTSIAMFEALHPQGLN